MNDLEKMRQKLLQIEVIQFTCMSMLILLLNEHDGEVRNEAIEFYNGALKALNELSDGSTPPYELLSENLKQTMQ